MGLYFMVFIIIIIDFILGADSAKKKKKTFPSPIPISLLKMEITAIRFSRCPLIKINEKWRRKEGRARASHSTSPGIDGWGVLVRGWTTRTSEWLAGIQLAPSETPPKATGHPCVGVVSGGELWALWIWRGAELVPTWRPTGGFEPLLVHLVPGTGSW